MEPSDGERGGTYVVPKKTTDGEGGGRKVSREESHTGKGEGVRGPGKKQMPERGRAIGSAARSGSR